MCASNSHRYTHLILALGIIGEPTVWGYIILHSILAYNDIDRRAGKYECAAPCDGGVDVELSLCTCNAQRNATAQNRARGHAVCAVLAWTAVPGGDSHRPVRGAA